MSKVERFAHPIAPYYRVYSESDCSYMTVPADWSASTLSLSLQALGEHWAPFAHLPPPLGERPDFKLVDRQRAEIDRLHALYKELTQRFDGVSNAMAQIARAVLPSQKNIVWSYTAIARETCEEIDRLRAVLKVSEEEREKLRAQCVQFDGEWKKAMKERNEARALAHEWEEAAGENRYLPKAFVDAINLRYGQPKPCPKLDPREAAWRQLDQHATPQPQDIVNAIEAYVQAAKV